MNTQDTLTIGIIGGTGLYSFPGLSEAVEHDIDTPFGKPSAPIVVGKLDGNPVAFLARHGLHHSLIPSEINFRANFYALKLLGVQKVVSVNAVGSLREDYAPGDIVIPDQLFDFTRDRKRTFFGDGIVAHIGAADPFCFDLSNQIANSLVDTEIHIHRGGTFITIEGPRFSTKAESNLFRNWGMSIIGMNTAPEAFLAREAEMCFAVMAHVTDYDVWHTTDEPVNVEMILQRLANNTEIAQQAIKNLVKNASQVSLCSCSEALKNTIVTPAEMIPTETRQKLGIFIEKYLN
jgi:5'-methylthioadenosine phosphorylase